MAATLPFTPTLTKQPQPHLNYNSTKFISYTTTTSTALSQPRPRNISCTAYKVTIEHQGKSTELEVNADETILSKALDSGLDTPHDCKLGVCMTCPAKLRSGKVDQSEGMLSDDVVQRGYALLCVAYPLSDCTITTIPEDELLSLQLATSND